MLLAILVIICALVCLGVLFWTLYAINVMNEAPFVPISKKILKQIYDLADLADDSVFYDLGCGDGRVLFYGSSQHPNAKFIGVEKGPLAYLLAKLKNRKQKNVSILRKNFFKTDLSQATHVYTYLFPEPMEELYEKFRNELKPGASVISCDFKMTKMDATQTISTGRSPGFGRTIYLYKF